ncbi:MAG: restriction endonuclease subunit S, partial [Rubrobacteraceae bacterium]
MHDQLRYAQPGDVILAGVGETVDDVGKAVAWLGDGPVAIHDDSFLFRSDLDPTFVSYYLQTNAFHAEKEQHVSRAKVKRLSSDGLKKVSIPVPPPEVQFEIVRILETYTTLEATLEAEHKLRRCQYAHYRESLLSFADSRGVEWRPMGSVGEFSRGRRFTKNDIVEDGLEAIHYGEIYTTYGVATVDTVSHVRTELAGQLRYAKTGDIVIAGVGETVEDVGKAVAWLGDGEVAIHDDTFGFHHDMNPRFVSYFLQTEAFHSQKGKHVSRAKVKRLSKVGLEKIVVPVPDREEQDRIVEILDKLDALVNDMSIGLPAEIAARRRQYEYYRDK